jgi:putative DNA primase/helicase
MTERPVPLQVFPANIPQALKAVPQWVCWKYEWNGKKWTKPPFQTNGYKASKTNPQHYFAFDKVLAAYEAGGFDGIGFVLTANDPFVAIDIDHCITDEDGLSVFAKEMLSLFNSYSEISPSGKGLRIITKGVIPRNIKKPEIEMYHCDSYVTITGNEVD